jgi:hypothetical protein
MSNSLPKSSIFQAAVTPQIPEDNRKINSVAEVENCGPQI